MRINKLTVALDFNKLMVPTPLQDTAVVNPTLLEGMFGSFSDAPGGFPRRNEGNYHLNRY